MRTYAADFTYPDSRTALWPYATSPATHIRGAPSRRGQRWPATSISSHRLLEMGNVIIRLNAFVTDVRTETAMGKSPHRDRRRVPRHLVQNGEICQCQCRRPSCRRRRDAPALAQLRPPAQRLSRAEYNDPPPGQRDGIVGRRQTGEYPRKGHYRPVPRPGQRHLLQLSWCRHVPADHRGFRHRDVPGLRRQRVGLCLPK